MRFLLSSLICAVAANALPAFAQSGANEDNVTLYMDAIALPKKARICAAKQSDFSAKFESAFAKWRTANKTKLADGERQARAAAKASNIAFPSNVEAETDMAAQMLQMMPEAQLKQRCADLLVQLAVK